MLWMLWLSHKVQFHPSKKCVGISQLGAFSLCALHTSSGGMWAWLGARARVSLKWSLQLARAPGDVKRSAESKRIFKQAVDPLRALRSPLLTKSLVRYVFLPQTELSPRLKSPCSVRAPTELDIYFLLRHPTVREQRNRARDLLVRGVCVCVCAGLRWPAGGGRATMLRPWAAHWIDLSL